MVDVSLSSSSSWISAYRRRSDAEGSGEGQGHWPRMQRVRISGTDDLLAEGQSSGERLGSTAENTSHWYTDHHHHNCNQLQRTASIAPLYRITRDVIYSVSELFARIKRTSFGVRGGGWGTIPDPFTDFSK